ncbi:SH2 domain-containing protein 4B-like isoform X1 [Mizuhopecten yessoensis]|uniref:SH2 domain-containing protein 4B-like isoform X1 n=1 Tax=Mizuhopecten yessoensis TaxID=6573 RepID=UPI000B459E5B|nr:SH2 domain-containing protein 4B-like isoform X1 [Mizuhopecten yessoensis]XP_021358817.1 SH2 domain-containing protein 4B-like isoform X1 [Mizuhopecten yessoensis]
MLQQILQDMFIDPELLAELSEEQKQVLFVKMREEQVRRWTESELKLEIEDKKCPRKRKPGRKGFVKFLNGSDGHEWVWVMGDHAKDKKIDEMLEEEAKNQALREAELEMEKLSQQEEFELKQRMDRGQCEEDEAKKKLEEDIRRKKEEAEMYQSIKEARLMAQRLEEEKKKEEHKRVEILRLRACKKCEDLQQSSFAQERRVSMEKVEKAKRRRSNELYVRWKEMRRQIEQTAEEESQEVEDNWHHREKQAKEAEKQMQTLAKRAREEHHNSLRISSSVISAASAFADGTKPPLPPKPKYLTQNALASQNGISGNKVSRKKRSMRPKNKDDVIKWFLEEEKPQGVGIDLKTKTVATWFHGVISRVDAELMLQSKTLGAFLVRVSERVWGYTISYRAEDRCKHFLIDTSEAGYQFFGANQVLHASLHELIEFHKNNPITVMGGEKLRHPVGQSKDPPDYQGLLQPKILESTSL